MVPKVAEEGGTIPAAPQAKQIPIFVCGDPTGNNSMTFYNFYNPLGTRPIKLPENWEQLIKDTNKKTK